MIGLPWTMRTNYRATYSKGFLQFTMSAHTALIAPHYGLQNLLPIICGHFLREISLREDDGDFKEFFV